MSQRAVEQVVGKLVTDEQFRDWFYREPAVAARATGLELTDDELLALTEVPRETVTALSLVLDDRICRMHVPGAFERSS